MWDPPAGLTEEQIKTLHARKSIFSKKRSALTKYARVTSWSGSQRPSSWKEASRHPFIHHCLILLLSRHLWQVNIMRSNEEDIAILKGYGTEIGGDVSKFGPRLREHSDCSSHEKDGDLAGSGRGRCRSRSKMRRRRLAERHAPHPAHRLMVVNNTSTGQDNWSQSWTPRQ